MAEYQPRTSAPSSSNKNWIRFDKGGYNYCIEISGGSCLPNCVGYCWGRWREILGDYHKLSRGNAENWWDNNDGYKRGQTPKVGAVMCWRKGQAHNGTDGAGHVAIVEKVLDDGKTVITSESNYGGTRWYSKTRTYPYNLGGSYAFQGFIYLPITFDEASEPKKEVKSVEVIAQEVLDGKWGNGTDRRKKLTDAGYNYAEVQAKVNQLFAKKNTTTKSIDTLAKEVLAGKWGNGADRKKRLTAAGYNYAQIQERVNQLLKKEK